MKRFFLLLMCVVLFLPTVLAEALLVKRCPSCGWEISSDRDGVDFTRDFAKVKFCRNCGTELVEGPAEEKGALANVKIGDIITFGHYEQDNNLSNGAEEIEWIVLDQKDDRILVISKYGLDCKPYNEDKKAVTWEHCTLRAWLNDDFLKAAFSSTEQARISTVTVAAQKNLLYDTNPGNDTQDQVFLLSLSEASKYFGSDSARKCSSTAYAKKQGASTNSDGFCWWWLRSPGNGETYAARISFGGSFNERGDYAYGDSNAVRPAMWISLSEEPAAKAAESIAIQAEIGDVITFGHYEQDNNLSNGAEEIEWIVLDQKDDRILVVSKYGLDCKPYNEVNEAVTWENCTLRAWLNNDFRKAAFSGAEQAMIPIVTVADHQNPDYTTDPGNNTLDKIFLLSITEAEKYLYSSHDRKCMPTAYARIQAGYTDSDLFCWWWLRSPGGTQNRAASGDTYGSLPKYGNYVYLDNRAVRPALWIDLNP